MVVDVKRRALIVGKLQLPSDLITHTDEVVLYYSDVPDFDCRSGSYIEHIASSSDMYPVLESH